MLQNNVSSITSINGMNKIDSKSYQNDAESNFFIQWAYQQGNEADINDKQQNIRLMTGD